MAGPAGGGATQDDDVDDVGRAVEESETHAPPPSDGQDGPSGAELGGWECVGEEKRKAREVEEARATARREEAEAAESQRKARDIEIALAAVRRREAEAAAKKEAEAVARRKQEVEAEAAARRKQQQQQQQQQQQEAKVTEALLAVNMASTAVQMPQQVNQLAALEEAATAQRMGAEISGQNFPEISGEAQFLAKFNLSASAPRAAADDAQVAAHTLNPTP